jgi:hypothetical protein
LLGQPALVVAIDVVHEGWVEGRLAGDELGRPLEIDFSLKLSRPEHPPVGERAFPPERLHRVQQLVVAQRALDALRLDGESILELVDCSQQQL